MQGEERMSLPLPEGGRPVEKNPYGANRKARRALKAEDRRAARRIKRLIGRLNAK